MATWDDVGRIASVLPDTEEHRPRKWAVHGKTFAWERPLRRRDLDELGTGAPTPHPSRSTCPTRAKLALVGDEPSTFFTTAHFAGYPIVLARLDRVTIPELEELLEDSWLARAPKALAQSFLDATE
ncbi:MmcQ/YjbR family DNA-binding protein [Oerskovia sp. M15]